MLDTFQEDIYVLQAESCNGFLQRIKKSYIKLREKEKRRIYDPIKHL